MPNEFSKYFLNEVENKKPVVLQNITKEFGTQLILDDVSLSINPNDRIGLVGKNGSGKSTLLRITAGIIQPDKGQIVNPGLKIGYLDQNYQLNGNKTIYEIATENATDFTNALSEFEEMSKDYRNNDLGFIQKYEYLFNYLQENNIFELHDQVSSILEHLGIDKDLTTSASILSGGQSIRLALAQLLISKPDILLLDEPTNHLDLQANMWLKNFLSKWENGLLVVSHNRDFLNEITTSTWELENGKIKLFGGNYDFYKEQKNIEEESRRRENVRLTTEVKKAKRKIEKEKERAAHSSRKDLSKKPEDQDRFRAHFFKERAEKTAGQKNTISENKKNDLSEQLISIQKKREIKIIPVFTESESYKGKLLVQARNISCNYDDNKIIEDSNFTIYFGDRIAIFGKNGSGKSTFINGLIGYGDVKTEGEIETSSNINIQLLDQKYSVIDRNKTILENMIKIAPFINLNEIRQHLARFLFRETTEVDKLPKILSGGEIARLALAMMTIQPIDLLILDEPTNNLDVDSVEEIEEVLSEFKGALLIISHDLTFLKNIGVSHSYVINNKRITPLQTNPIDNEDFEKELSLRL